MNQSIIGLEKERELHKKGTRESNSVLITQKQHKQTKTLDQKEKNKTQGNIWKYGYDFGTLKRKRRFEVFVIFSASMWLENHISNSRKRNKPQIVII